MKRVLMLGAGLVVKPLLDELLADPKIELRLATLNVERARALLAGRPRGQALEVNATEEEQLRPEVAQADVVVSLLPAEQHAGIARACVERGAHLVTTSYVSEAMRAYDAMARERGVLLLNECGLDPGIDHMSAVALIRRAQSLGDEVVSLRSYCGGLPAPEANNNPWGYKFTWSPRGVVLAARNPVRYLEGGKVFERPFPDLFDQPRQLEIEGVGRLEAYPNRDCLRYQKPYGLQSARDFFRGTLRYPGWCETWHSMVRLGLLEAEPKNWQGHSWADFLSHQLPPGTGALRARLARALGIEEGSAVPDRLEWLGLFSPEPLDVLTGSPLDIITSLLERRLRYQPGECDLVVLRHELGARKKDGNEYKLTSQLLLRGTAGDDSAMARTVSLPAALATKLLLSGRISLAGVRLPTEPELVGPILEGLSERGIQFADREENSVS